MQRLLPRALVVATLTITAAAGTATAAVAAPPVTTSGTATEVTRTTAKLAGTVDPGGLATTYRFQYGTSSSYGLSTGDVTLPASETATAVTATLTGLTDATTYHYRLTATNAAGETRGADRTLTTAAPAAPAAARAPAVATDAARTIATTSAIAVGRVNPQGVATQYQFEYGTTTALGLKTPLVSAGAGTKTLTVKRTISGLLPSTRYYFRIVAANAIGRTNGSTRNFTTLRAPTGITASVPANPILWGAGTEVRGQLSGRGIGGTPLALEQQDFPFTAPFREVRRVTADSKGAYRVTLSPLWNAVRLRVVTRTTIVAASRVLQIESRVLAGVRLTPTRTRTTLAGAISPAVPAARVSVQRKTQRGTWLLVKRVKTTPLGTTRSRYRVRFRRSTRTRVMRVVVTPNDGGAHARGISREVTVPGRRR